MTDGTKPFDLTISSTVNPRIKALIKLRKRRERNRTSLFLLEGIREIEAALDGGICPVEVYFCPTAAEETTPLLLGKLREKGAAAIHVSQKVFDRIAYRESSGGLVIVATSKIRTLDTLPVSDRPLYLVIDAVEKPGNLGAMFRSADGAGGTAVIVTAGGTDMYNPNIIRASIGTVFTIAWAQASTTETIEWLRDGGISIVVATPAGNIDYTSIDMKPPCAIVVGSEDTGAGSLWLEGSDRNVRIPMFGRADSLNVAVSAALLMYEARRQRDAIP